MFNSGLERGVTDLKIIAVTRVLNEADIIEALVRHTSAYVQHHIFMDNGSADGTVEILSALKQEGFPITVFQSRAVTFNEGDALTFMYNVASSEHSPDSVVYIDADEFIDDRQIEGGLVHYHSNLTNADDPIECIRIPMVNYVATSKDNPAEPIVPVRMRRRLPPSDAYKIILKGCLPQGDILIEHGSHSAHLQSRDLKSVVNRDLWLAHYSERSAFQYVTKFVRGWSKVLATGRSEVLKKTAYHYRPAYEFLRDTPQNLLRNEQFMGFKNETNEVILDPIEYRGGSLKYTGSPDEAMRAVRALMGFFQELAISHGNILEDISGAREKVRALENRVQRIISGPLTVPPGLFDLTLGAQTDQSSVSRWSHNDTTQRDSANAIAKDFSSAYAFHTDQDETPWWSIDFGKRVIVKEIRIYNRIDDISCAARGSHFAIEAAFGPLPVWQEIARREGLGPFGIEGGTPFIWQSDAGVCTEMLRLRLLEPGIMHYRKIEVFGVDEASTL